ncbi:MAG: hypothetical protein PHY08_12235 [Candidatus Cloacimonetes bacterium]|nr:hypothetical protein [Candidatus Cloacimonadota bacterium]
MKKYNKYYSGMTKDDVFKGLLKEGLFTEQLPPMFQSSEFFDFVINTPKVSFSKKRQFQYPSCR